MQALSLLTLTLLFGCSFTLPPQPSSNNCEDDTGTEEMFSVNAERIVNGEARLNTEFIPDWGQPGDYGWHMSYFWNEDDALEMSLKKAIVEEIIGAMTDFTFQDVTCVRFNITYGDNCEYEPSSTYCKWLCEGNGDSTHLTTDLEFDWFFQDWTVGTWSDPGGAGCSALACSANIYDITAH